MCVPVKDLNKSAFYSYNFPIFGLFMLLLISCKHLFGNLYLPQFVQAEFRA